MAICDCNIEPGGGTLNVDHAVSASSVRDFPPTHEPWARASIPGGSTVGGGGACQNVGKEGGMWGQSHGHMVGGRSARWVSSAVQWRYAPQADGLLRLPPGIGDNLQACPILCVCVWVWVWVWVCVWVCQAKTAPITCPLGRRHVRSTIGRA